MKLLKPTLTLLLSTLLVLNSAAPAFTRTEQISDAEAKSIFNGLSAATLSAGALTAASGVSSAGFFMTSICFKALAKARIINAMTKNGALLSETAQWAFSDVKFLNSAQQAMWEIEALKNAALKEGMLKEGASASEIYSGLKLNYSNRLTPKMESLLAFNQAAEEIKAADNTLAALKAGKVSAMKALAQMNESLITARVYVENIKKIEETGLAPQSAIFTDKANFFRLQDRLADSSKVFTEAESGLVKAARAGKYGKILVAVAFAGLVLTVTSVILSDTPKTLTAGEISAFKRSEGYIFEMTDARAKDLGLYEVKQAYKTYLSQYQTDEEFREIYQAVLNAPQDEDIFGFTDAQHEKFKNLNINADELFSKA